jgi:acetyl-CoA C-acetyltransferase
MQRDDCEQVTGEADDHQIKGARRMQTLNFGGSTTILVSFIIERDAA